MPTLTELDQALWQLIQIAEATPTPASELTEETRDDPEHNEVVWIHRMTQLLDGEIEEKYKAISRVLRQMDAEISVVSDEKKRLEDKERALRNKKESLESWATQRLADLIRKVDGTTALPKFKDSLDCLRLQKSPDSIEVVNEKKIPEGKVGVLTDVNGNLMYQPDGEPWLLPVDQLPPGYNGPVFEFLKPQPPKVAKNPAKRFSDQFGVSPPGFQRRINRYHLRYR